MTEEPIGFSPTIDELHRVELLLAVARSKGSLLSAKDIDELTSLLPSGYDLGSIWDQIPSLHSQYWLRAGLLIGRKADNDRSPNDTMFEANRRRARAEKYIECAREFSLLSGTRWVRVLSVAGSASYMTAKENEDVDIFCVAEKDSLWIYLTKALLLARVFRLLRPGSPRLCFSYALDEECARRLFASPNDALFARDALTAQVLQGSPFYDDLLRSGLWLSDYFPKMQKLRKIQNNETLKETGVTRLTVAREILNHFLYLTVGNYVRLKSTIRNLRLKKAQRRDSLFTIVSGRDHCIFESQSYQKLREVYAGFKPYSTERLSYHSEKVGLAR